MSSGSQTFSGTSPPPLRSPPPPNPRESFCENNDIYHLSYIYYILTFTISSISFVSLPTATNI